MTDEKREEIQWGRIKWVKSKERQSGFALPVEESSYFHCRVLCETSCWFFFSLCRLFKGLQTVSFKIRDKAFPSYSGWRRWRGVADSLVRITSFKKTELGNCSTHHPFLLEHVKSYTVCDPYDGTLLSYWSGVYSLFLLLHLSLCPSMLNYLLHTSLRPECLVFTHNWHLCHDSS